MERVLEHSMVELTTLHAAFSELLMSLNTASEQDPFLN